MAEYVEDLDCSSCGFSHSRFSYPALETTRGIRLLQLRAGQPDDEIHCTIWNTSLEDESVTRDTYVALSYVWGDASLLSTILCNGVYFHVTKNLEDALRALRSVDEPRTLWIDQICINQADNDERCAQVQIMRYIYKKASQVIAWLGAATRDTKVAFEFAHNLLEKMRETLDDDDLGKLAEENGLTEMQMKGMGVVYLLGGDNPGWLALQHMFERTWFSRIWVIQEIIMAADLVLQWGSESVSWKVLVEVVVKSNQSLFILPRIFRNSSTACARFIIMRFQPLKEEVTVNLQDLLTMSAAHASTDPRDKIYALLGLIKGKSDFGILPDYNITASTLYRNTAKAILEEESNLRLLVNYTQTVPRQRLAGLPSWCPDWSIHNVLLENRPYAGWDEFRADGGASSSFRWHEDPSLLTVRGKLVDAVLNSGIFFEPPLFDYINQEDFEHVAFTHYRRLASLLNSCKELASSTASKGSDWTESEWYWRALIGGLDVGGNLADGDYSQHYQYYTKYVYNAAKVVNYDDIGGIAKDWSGKQKQGSVAYSRSVLQAGNERYFIATENGRLGWLPMATESGDRIAIIYGSRMPWVIRASGDDKWILVCCCYIDGVMLGETMDDNEFTTMDITLC